MPVVTCGQCHGACKAGGKTCSVCGGTGQLNAPGDPTFKKHFFDNGTYIGRYGGQDYFRSDGSPWGVGPKDDERKRFDAREWQ